MVCFFFISLSLWLLFVFHLFVGVKHAPAIPSYTPLQGPAPSLHPSCNMQCTLIATHHFYSLYMVLMWTPQICISRITRDWKVEDGSFLGVNPWFQTRVTGYKHCSRNRIGVSGLTWFNWSYYRSHVQPKPLPLKISLQQCREGLL